MRALRPWSRGVAVVAVVAGLASPASGQVTTFSAILSGANENPPNASPGTGTFFASYSASTQLLSINITFQGLVGTTTASHIHCCVAPPGNTGVATPVPYFPGFPIGVQSGTYSNVFDLSLASSFNPTFVTAQGSVANARNALIGGMTNGTAYINIHTRAYPGGEIRGFITATPEPATVALTATGLLALGGVGLRRRRR